jgi:hypothetical protein
MPLWILFFFFYSCPFPECYREVIFRFIVTSNIYYTTRSYPKYLNTIKLRASVVVVKLLTW